MSTPAKILFVDRDGTLIVEPPDQQIDSYAKLRLVPSTISALRRCVEAGYELVMVSNQDGLGSASFPEADFDGPQALLLDILAGEGIVFREVLIDRHFAHEHAPTRKPGVGMVRHYLVDGVIDRARSAVIGDRDSDLELAANMGLRGFCIGESLGWPQIASALLDAPRSAQLERKTRETSISVAIDLDAAPRARISTGIGFFDHMLEQLAVHGGFALELRCAGDLAVDEHHSVEDCALALGQALRSALGERRGIARYGFDPSDLPQREAGAIAFALPMDESRADVVLDLSGRAGFVFSGSFPREAVGGLPCELVPHFFHSLADALAATLHLRVVGSNAHHMIEACFKATGRALRQAIRIESAQIPSSKGMLAGGVTA